MDERERRLLFLAMISMVVDRSPPTAPPDGAPPNAIMVGVEPVLVGSEYVTVIVA